MFIIQKKIIVDLLSKSIKALDKKPISDIMGSVLITIKNNRLRLMCTDSIKTIMTMSNNVIKSDSDEEYIVPAKKLYDILCQMPNDSINFNITDNILAIESNRIKFNLPILRDNFPKPQHIDLSSNIDIDREEFIKAITAVTPFTEQYQQLPASVHFSILDNTMTIAALSHNGCGFYELPINNKNSIKEELTLAIEDVNILFKLFDNNTNFKIIINYSNIYFVSPDVYAILPLIAQAYPDYKNVYKYMLQGIFADYIIEKSSFSQAIERVYSVVKDDIKQLHKGLALQFDANNLSISTQGKNGYGKENIDINGIEKIYSVFGYHLLAKSISGITEKYLNIKLKTDGTQIMLNNYNDKFKAIIMGYKNA